MGNGTDRVLDELQGIRETLGKQATTLERLTTTVEVHEKRSTTLEAMIKPLRTHVDRVEGVLMAAGVVGILGLAGKSLWAWLTG